MVQEQAILYSFPSCNSSRRVKSWLDLNKIKYVERKVLREPIGKDEILTMLRLTEEGFDDIISIKNIGDASIAKSIEEFKFNQLIDYIVNNPNLLKKPILVLNGKLLVGWNKTKYREISLTEINK